MGAVVWLLELVVAGVVDVGAVDVEVVEVVVDVLFPLRGLLPLPAVDLPAGPPACVPLLFCGPLGVWDFLDFPDPVWG